MGIPVVEGRNFAVSDREGAPLVAVVNESMARRFWPTSSAVGRTFRLSFGTGQDTVIGVTRDHRVHTVAENPTPYLHFSALQRPSRFNHLLARTSGDAGALVVAMRRELLTLEPGLVFISSSTMEKSLEASLLPERVGAVLAAGFGGAWHPAGRDRPLRRHRILRDAPHARDWRSHGHWRGSTTRAGVDHASRPRARRGWRSRRPGSGCRSRAGVERRPVWRRGVRPARLDHGARSARCRCSACQLRPGSFAQCA